MVPGPEEAEVSDEELAEASCSVPAYERENDPHNGALDDAAFEEEDDE